MEASLVETVNGRGRSAGRSTGTNSRGLPFSRYFFNCQLRSVAPAVEKTARTASVSTTTSRAPSSDTTGVDTGPVGAGLSASIGIAPGTTTPAGTPVAG